MHVEWYVAMPPGHSASRSWPSDSDVPIELSGYRGLASSFLHSDSSLSSRKHLCICNSVTFVVYVIMKKNLAQYTSRRAASTALLPSNPPRTPTPTRFLAPASTLAWPSKTRRSMGSLRPPFICAQCASRLKSTQSRFITTSTLRKQVASVNPRYGEDGEEMTLEITSRAANRLSQIREKDQNPNLALRVTVESGGCHGFQYIMGLTDLPSSPGSTGSEAGEDTIFEGEHGAKIVLDEPSLELLHGSKVDYTMELIGSQFKITGNPRASSSCGCGTSFDVKVD